MLGRIVDTIEAAGAVLQALYPIGSQHDDPACGPVEPRILGRFRVTEVADVVAALQAAGYPVFESTAAPRAALAGRVELTVTEAAPLDRVRSTAESWSTSAEPKVPPLACDNAPA